MSQFLKQVLRCTEGQLSAGTWSSPVHNYLLVHKGMRYLPTSYYLSRSEQSLPQGHGRDANQLAYIAYALNKENLNLIAQQNTSSSNHTQARTTQREQRIQENETTISNYSKELNSMISMSYGLTAEGIVNSMVINEVVNQGEKSIYVYLVPLFLQKTQLMSLGNLTEALEVILNNSCIDRSTKESLLTAILDELSTRSYTFQPVNLDPVYLDKYRHTSQNTSNPICSNIMGTLQTIAKNEHGFKVLSGMCSLMQSLKVRVFNRVMHRESRITSQLSSDFQMPIERYMQVLNTLLSSLSTSHPHLEQQIQTVHQRIHQ